MPEIMIFKAGKYPQGDWPKERVQRMVDAYDPEKNYEAPIVIGHRFYGNTDESQYAHGWVKSLRVDGAGKVFAEIPEFSALVKQAMAENKLRYVSAEIYELDKIEDSQSPYLRAISLLGRDTPQIPTTRLPSLFGLMAGGAVTTVNEEEHIAAFTRKVNADDTLSFGRQENTEHPNEEDDMGKVEDLQEELEKSNAALAAFQKENEDLKNAGRKVESTAFFSKLRDEGRLTPALFDRTIALDMKLGDEERKELRALFSELDTKVDLSGTHAADKKNAPAPAAASADLTARIRAFQAEKKLAGFAEAAAALYAEKPELFNEEEKA